MDVPEFTFEEFIRIWARVALALIFVEAYLTINKIWIRKHERVVSESVSVSAQLLALVTGVPFIGLYVMEGAYEGAISDGVFLLVNVIMIAIGIGFWVEGRRRLGFLQNLNKALRLEKGEAHRKSRYERSCRSTTRNAALVAKCIRWATITRKPTPTWFATGIAILDT